MESLRVFQQGKDPEIMRKTQVGVEFVGDPSYWVSRLPDCILPVGGISRHGASNLLELIEIVLNHCAIVAYWVEAADRYVGWRKVAQTWVETRENIWIGFLLGAPVVICVRLRKLLLTALPPRPLHSL